MSLASIDTVLVLGEIMAPLVVVVFELELLSTSVNAIKKPQTATRAIDSITRPTLCQTLSCVIVVSGFRLSIVSYVNNCLALQFILIYS